MNDYDVQMAEAESSDTRAGDYSRRYRDRQILLRQYPGPDAKRFFSWTRGPLCVEPRPLAQAGSQGDSLLACGTRQRRRPSRLERARRREAHWTVVAPLSPV